MTWPQRALSFVAREMCIRDRYECKKRMDSAAVKINLPVKSAWLCDMLENKEEEAAVTDGVINLDFKAFEIKTVRIALK